MFDYVSSNVTFNNDGADELEYRRNTRHTQDSGGRHQALLPGAMTLTPASGATDPVGNSCSTTVAIEATPADNEF